MKKAIGLFLLLCGTGILWSPPAIAEPQRSTRNLVENPGFEVLDSATGLPEGWRTMTPRHEVAPAFEVDSSVSHSGRSSARSTARGSAGTIGFWVTTVRGIQAGAEAEGFGMSELTVREADFLSSKSYRVACFFKVREVESPARNIWISVTWLNGKGQEVFTEFLSQFVNEGEWYRVEQVLTAPRAARSLSLELVLQWTATGTVWWDDVSVEEVSPLAPRQIKVGTIYDMPSEHSTPEKNRGFYAGKIAEAGKLGVDLLCLGEGITLVSTGRKYADVAESVPGPTSQILGEAARKSKLYVVAGIYEREGPLIYNTALLIDREGNVAGKYRKTHLPETEVNGKIGDVRAVNLVFQGGFYAAISSRSRSRFSASCDGSRYSCVMDESYFLAALRYVERNPVRAGLVKRAEDYQRSSAAAHCFGRKDSLLAPLPFAADFLARWSECLAEDDPPPELKLIQTTIKCGRPCGLDGFIDKLEKLTGRQLELRKGGRPRKPKLKS